MNVANKIGVDNTIRLPSSAGTSVALPQSLCLQALASAMIILLYRPVIGRVPGVEGVTPAKHQALSSCTGADQIVMILRDYSRRFSISSAPYVLLYGTYISATIHARVVAHKGPSSKKFQSLLMCGDNRNPYLYAAAGRAKASIEKLISQLGIDFGDANWPIESPRDNPGEQQSAVLGDESLLHLPELPGQALELQLPETLEFSDYDIEALTRGFQLDGDLDYLIPPLGS